MDWKKKKKEAGREWGMGEGREGVQRGRSDEGGRKGKEKGKGGERPGGKGQATQWPTQWLFLKKIKGPY